eukprot:1160903-Pelagomonas_calceolata.AAC.3
MELRRHFPGQVQEVHREGPCAGAPLPAGAAVRAQSELCKVRVWHFRNACLCHDLGCKAWFGLRLSPGSFVQNKCGLHLLEARLCMPEQTNGWALTRCRACMFAGQYRSTKFCRHCVHPARLACSAGATPWECQAVYHPSDDASTSISFKEIDKRQNVRISDSALSAAATLSDRYITDRYLPDKALDLVDEAGARARVEASLKPEVSKSRGWWQSGFV